MYGMVSKVVGAVKSAVSAARAFCVYAVVAIVSAFAGAQSVVSGLGAVAVALTFALVSGGAWATDPITLPDTGIDFPGLIDAAVLVIGGAVASVILAYFAFKAIRIAISWTSKMGG